MGRLFLTFGESSKDHAVIFALTIGPTIQIIASKAGQELARQTVSS
jgi:hypothetical protein